MRLSEAFGEQLKPFGYAIRDLSLLHVEGTPLETSVGIAEKCGAFFLDQTSLDYAGKSPLVGLLGLVGVFLNCFHSFCEWRMERRGRLRDGPDSCEQ